MDTKQKLIQTYQQIRAQTEAICSPLLIEDYVIQSMSDVSPPKWHLAHTTWFFETFILMAQQKNYHAFHPSFQYLFNSYYQALASQLYPRVNRGLLSRPSVNVVYQYRRYVDEHMLNHIYYHAETASFATTFMLGLQHEQQHQELLLMDIKHNFSLDPNFPAYQTNLRPSETSISPTTNKWVTFPGGMIQIGHQEDNFCFDNELPHHALYLHDYGIATQLVTNQEYLEFIEAGAYQKAEYWLADGWDCVEKQGWQAPLYWHYRDDKWYVFTLNGLQELNLNEPVVHISYYEADAYAHFRGARLPREAEWEHAVRTQQITPVQGNFLEDQKLHPDVNTGQFFGDVWEWTASAYSPYPGYKPVRGALGEYNGKFMSNQFVLRGGACITPRSHIRVSYRNFFQPDKRWAFSGIRLAQDK